ncbi:MAG: M20/M25/M40 family metallo-hydrolase [Deltaproteobacteria bacterium]|nr:M20/M25/M40 family metallo-hydrolase [Deltaproteobacteria bacterium]
MTPRLHEGALERFRGALRFETVSYDDRSKMDLREFSKFHSYLEKSFPIVHEKLKKETVAEHSLLYTWRGSDASLKPILLMAHIDVVPVERSKKDEWKHPPFGGAMEDGFIWGRGALDTKCSLIGILEAVEQLLKKKHEPLRSVMMAFGHDEEVGGGEGASKTVELLESRGVELEYVLDEGGAIMSGDLFGIEPSVAGIGTAEKGLLNLELTATGDDGHAAMPPEQTAAGKICAAVAAIESNPFKARLTPVIKNLLYSVSAHMPLHRRLLFRNLWLFGGLVKIAFLKTPLTRSFVRTTAAVTQLEASDKANTLPSEAKAVVNLRILVGETISTVTRRIQELVGDEIEVRVMDELNHSNPVDESNIESKGYRDIKKTIGELFPDAVTIPYIVSGATDSRQYAPLTDSIYRFVAMRLSPEELGLIHGINERISIENYERLVDFFSLLIERSAAN